MPDSYAPALTTFEHRRAPPLAERFLAPPGFVWGSFATADGAVLRWGHLAADNPRAECVLVGGFGDFIEKQFETIRDLAARGLSVWTLDWPGRSAGRIARAPAASSATPTSWRNSPPSASAWVSAIS